MTVTIQLEAPSTVHSEAMPRGMAASAETHQTTLLLRDVPVSCGAGPRFPPIHLEYREPDPAGALDEIVRPVQETTLSPTWITSGTITQRQPRTDRLARRRGASSMP